MRLRTSWIGMALAGFAVVAIAAPAFAQDAKLDEPTEADKEAAPEATVTQAAPKRIEAIVRGFYLEMRVGGGYALPVGTISTDTANGTNYPQLAGADEGLGPGGGITMAAGYDIYTSDFLDFSAQLVGGATVISTTRRDIVRDLALYRVEGGVRAAFAVSDRLDALASAGVGFYSADNAVGEPEQGLGVHLSGGLEYYVHVRHFSVGAELGILMPMMPVRLFISISPTIKYTF